MAPLHSAAGADMYSYIITGVEVLHIIQTVDIIRVKNRPTFRCAYFFGRWKIVP